MPKIPSLSLSRFYSALRGRPGENWNALAMQATEQHSNQLASAINGLGAAATAGIATTSEAGIVKPDGTTITVDSTGKISAVTPSPASGGMVPGSVTSVGLAVPARQSVSGSPVTSSGTITITDNAESAHTAFMGPSSGSAAAPSFRSIVPSDLPVATSSTVGVVEPDNSTISVNGSGVISAYLPTGAANEVVATPNGSSGISSLRKLVNGDLSSAVMGASGSSHAAGATPDPGSIAGDFRYVREDGTFAPVWNSQAPLYVQSISGSVSGTSLTLTFGANVTIGDTLILGAFSLDSTSPTITDSQSNTWTQLAQGINSIYGTTDTLYSATASATGSLTITVTMPSGDSGLLQAIAAEYASVGGIDIKIAKIPGGNANTSIGTSATTAERNELVGAFVFGNGNSAVPSMPGWTERVLSIPNTFGLFEGYAGDIGTIISALATFAVTDQPGFILFSLYGASGSLTNPMTAAGDMIIGGASGTPARLAIGTSGYVLTSNGTDPEWAAQTALTNPMTTEGDIIYGGSSGTPERLGAGTPGYVLISNGSGAAPSWQAGAGGVLVKIGTVTVSGSSTSSVTFSSIPGTYSSLRIVGYGRTDVSGTGAANIEAQFNGDTGSNYSSANMYGGSGSGGGASTGTSAFVGQFTQAGDPSNAPGSLEVTIRGYANTTFSKTGNSTFGVNSGSGIGTIYVVNSYFLWNNTAAITSITLLLASGHFVAGTTFDLYGLA